MPTPETTWPAAVSQRCAPGPGGPVREARVLGAFPQALYLLDDDAVLPLVAPGGLRLPTAVLVARDPCTIGWGVQPGDVVLVGGGRIRLPGVMVRATRTWRPTPVPDGEVGRALPEVPATGVWCDRARRLAVAVLSGAPDLRSFAAGIVGAGPGLTPSGDDAVCGVLLGLRLAGRPDAAATLWAVVAPRLAATTSLSAALLHEAAQGYAVPPVVQLGRALLGGDRVRVEAAADVVRRVGHSSGADLLAGLAGCLDAVGATGPGATTRPHVVGGGHR